MRLERANIGSTFARVAAAACLALCACTTPPVKPLPPDPTAVQLAVRDFFAKAGVNFGPVPPVQAAPGAPARLQKAVFFNDRTGVLFVRTTRAELDLIEKALHGK